MISSTPALQFETQACEHDNSSTRSPRICCWTVVGLQAESSRTELSWLLCRVRWHGWKQIGQSTSSPRPSRNGLCTSKRAKKEMPVNHQQNSNGLAVDLRKTKNSHEEKSKYIVFYNIESPFRLEFKRTNQPIQPPRPPLRAAFRAVAQDHAPWKRQRI